MVITKGNKKVPTGLYVLNIPLIIIKRKNNYIHQIHVHLELAQPIILVHAVLWFRFIGDTLITCLLLPIPDYVYVRCVKPKLETIGTENVIVIHLVLK